MSKLHRVLVAVDFSKAARDAFDHALELSRMHDAELLVVHAVPADQLLKWHARERVALMGALSQAAHDAGVRIKVSVQQGDPAGVIVLHASARRADLIVIGTSERSGLDRFRFGSVAERVAREAAQPVLVVPAGRKAAASAPPFKNILVAVDFSDGSREAVERALVMANGDSRVTVMHAIRGVPFEQSYRYPYRLMEPEYQRNLARVAWRRIAAMVPADREKSRRVHTRVVTGDPTTEIARVAAEVDADLVLVGVTDRSLIGRLIMGSTAARVMRAVGRPVLAIPQAIAGAASTPDEHMPLAA